MLLVRPVKKSDHAEILALAREAGIGMTSLPPDAQVLEKKIARAVASFAGDESWAGDEAFLFVLEDTKAGKLVGTTGISAHVGLKFPFYSYKLSTIVQASKDAGIYSRQRVLHMVNDYTGTSEIGSLFLQEKYRRGGIGKFLSRARFLMMAEFPQVFADRVIAEIRGVQDKNGDSPFYKNLAQHFFQMDFKKADFINATLGSQFISDLMPKYPIYVALLHPDAQAVIGKPLAASESAMHLLLKEGFLHQGYIDLFDAGPTMQIERRNIATVRDSKKLPVADIAALPGQPMHMVANTALAKYSVAFTRLEEKNGGVTLDSDAARALGVKKGDAVRIIAC